MAELANGAGSETNSVVGGRGCKARFDRKTDLAFQSCSRSGQHAEFDDLSASALRHHRDRHLVYENENSRTAVTIGRLRARKTVGEIHAEWPAQAF